MAAPPIVRPIWQHFSHKDAQGFLVPPSWKVTVYVYHCSCGYWKDYGVNDGVPVNQSSNAHDEHCSYRNLVPVRLSPNTMAEARSKFPWQRQETELHELGRAGSGPFVAKERRMKRVRVLGEIGTEI